MTLATVPINIGDIVSLAGKPPRFIVREILPDGKHAVCVRAATPVSEAFFAAPGSTYASQAGTGSTVT